MPNLVSLDHLVETGHLFVEILLVELCRAVQQHRAVAPSFVHLRTRNGRSNTAAFSAENLAFVGVTNAFFVVCSF